MNEVGPWIALASLVVSLVVLAFGWLQFRHVANKDWVEQLDAQLAEVRRRQEECERDRGATMKRFDECQEARRALERERVDLLLEVRQLRGETPRRPLDLGEIRGTDEPG